MKRDIDNSKEKEGSTGNGWQGERKGKQKNNKALVNHINSKCCVGLCLSACKTVHKMCTRKKHKQTREV